MSTLGGPWGLLRDIPNGKDYDIRDHVSLGAVQAAAQGRPNRVLYMKNQRQHGACTVFMLERLMRMARQKAGLPDMDYSPLYGYYNARIRSGLSPTVDSGASIRGALDAGRLDGLCRESYWTYTNADGYLNVKPEAYAYEDGAQNQILEAFTMPNNIDMIIQALADGFGVGLGGTVFAQAFENSFVRTGDIQMPQNGDPVRGAHAFALDGWNTASARFDTPGSWGDNVAQGGFGTIPFDYITQYCFDIWAVRVVENPDPRPTPGPGVVTEIKATIGFQERVLFSGENAQNVRVNGVQVWSKP